jgi:hypothetical protein
MKIIKIEHPDHGPHEKIYLIVQTDKNQTVHYGHIGSTKRTWCSHGPGFVTLSTGGQGKRIADYHLNNLEMWDYIQSLTEDPELRLVWTTIDDDSKRITLSDHIDLYGGIKDE